MNPTTNSSTQPTSPEDTSPEADAMDFSFGDDSEGTQLSEADGLGDAPSKPSTSAATPASSSEAKALCLEGDAEGLGGAFVDASAEPSNTSGGNSL